jgi:hypothetical protein
LEHLSVMYQVSTVIFSEDSQAQVLNAEDRQEDEYGASWQVSPELLSAIGLPLQRPVLVLIGGASSLTDNKLQQMQRLFVEVLAPIAEKVQAVVVDGGTDTGIMRLMGQARSRIGGTFPLLGIVPRSLGLWPGEAAKSEQQAALEPNHTHFVLGPGDTWGDESAALAEIATLLSIGSTSVAVMLNGGSVTWKDAVQNVGQGRLLLVVNGSGRAADELCAIAQGGSASEEIYKVAMTILKSELVEVIELETESAIICERIERILNPVLQITPPNPQ